MRFTKMQGLGNDYVYIEDRDWRAAGAPDKPELVRRLSGRHFGIGGDGVIFINPSERADFEMEMYNADGTRAEMCGNGIRCVGKYVYDHGLTDELEIKIESMGKLKYLTLIPFPGEKQEGKRKLIQKVRVDMGPPEGIEDIVLNIRGKDYEMTALSMGNPHAVTFVEDVKEFPVVELGPDFECHPHFPDRTNTEFLQVIDRHTVLMRVYERGTGETMACGTGACAAAVTAIRKGLTENEVTIRLPGGDLLISWDGSGSVFMTGEAGEVFSGETLA